MSSSATPQDSFKTILGLMDLPDEDPDTFRLFVKWVYTRCNSHSTLTDIVYLDELFYKVGRKDLVRLYLFAIKFKAAALQDDLVYLFYDRLDRGHKNMASPGVDDEFLGHLGTHLTERAALYQLFSRALAFHMVNNPYHGIASPPPPRGPHHEVQGEAEAPHPSALSRAAMQYAAENIPARLMRSVVKRFFDLHARPDVASAGFCQGVGDLTGQVPRSRGRLERPLGLVVEGIGGTARIISKGLLATIRLFGLFLTFCFFPFCDLGGHHTGLNFLQVWF